jgi:hypothetical protein
MIPHFLCLEQSRKAQCCVLLHRGQDMGIDPQGDFDALMS